MKKRKILAAASSLAAVATIVAPVATLTSCGEAIEHVQIQPVEKDGTIIILATGGTIAGSGEEGKETGYKPGSISVESLIASVPGLGEIAPLQAEQVCNINSDDMTSKIWVHLAKTINAYQNDPKVKGFVIMHGTDTMEETAYFLNLAVHTKKPVVITGSMRPATAISADGPMNLYQSVVVANSDEAVGQGVLGVFSDQIFSARSMQKLSTLDVTAISAGPMGALGFVRNKEVFFYEKSIKLNTWDSEFSTYVETINYLPQVPVVYFQADANPAIIDWIKKENYRGLVMAGAGAGEFSEAFIKKLNDFNGQVVISSRIDSGVITQDSVLVKKGVAANDLPPQKAAILLRFALAKYGNLSQDDLREKLIDLFKKY